MEEAKPAVAVLAQSNPNLVIYSYPLLALVTEGIICKDKTETRSQQVTAPRYDQRMGWTSPEARELFQWFVKHEAKRRNCDRERVVEALHEVPVSQETLKALEALSPEDADRALRKHPGYIAHRKIESVRTMLELFRRALTDLDQSIAEFPDFNGPDNRIAREQLEQAVSVKVNKEFFAALGGAKTLLDYSRRVKGLVDTDLFESRLKLAYEPGEHALIIGLRNVLLHEVHLRANWQVRWHAGTKTKHFVIQREDLLADGKLNNVALQYLDRLGTTCDVTVLLRGYAKKVDQFYMWLLAEVEAHLPLEVEDYRTCRKAVRRQHGKLSYEIMIGLWTQAGADPYQHLPKHLTSEQMEHLKTLPHRSPQQVDYIIACMDKDGICDDHLRRVVHKFFKVISVDDATDHAG